MSSSSPLIAPIDIAICDPDLLWRVDHLNAVKGVTVREFESAADALEIVTPGHAVVLVIGPSSPPDELEAISAAGPKPGWLRVIVVDRAGSQDLSAAAARLKVDRVLSFRSEGAEFAEAVLEVLARDAEPGGPTDPAADVQSGIETPVDPGVLTGPADPGFAGVVLEGQTAEAARSASEVILVTAAKGGEGASTIALNLALEISGPSVRVALVDGDPTFGDLALDLGLPPSPRPVAGAAAPPDTITPPLIIDDASELLLMQMPAPSGRDGPRDRIGELDALSDLIAIARQRADIVVVDLPIETLLETEQLSHTTRILIVTTGHTASVKNALLATERLGSKINVGLVINEIDRHPNATPPDEIAAAVGLPLLAHLPYDRTLARSASEPASRLVAERHSRYRRAIRALRTGPADGISRTETQARPGEKVRNANLYEHIIVPFDGTSAAQGASMVGVDLARRMEAELVVMTASGMDGAASVRQLKARSMAMSDASVTIWQEPEVNEVKAISSMVGFRPNSLICMSTSARTGVRRAAYGSLAERLLRELDVPLVLVGPRWAGGSVADLSHLVICVDATPRADAAVALAATWAGALPLTATLVHVRTDIDAPRVDLDRLAEPLEPWCPLIEKLTVQNSDVVEGILEVVKDSISPLVVMAASVRGGLDRMVHGSVMASLIGKCEVPVLVRRAGS
jgi:MinD-like ATPase involved in chromosome partitioning or flagellar assembly